MNKEWFEPGPDGESPFVRKYNASPGTAGNAIAAAFRALLAGEEATEPPALQVGDVVRLERYESNPNGLSWFESEAHLIGTEEKISGIYEDGTVWLSVNTCWPVSALTLIRRAGEAAPADAKDAEIARLTAEVERWKSRADAHEQNYRAMLRRVDEVAAERDALQARVDAGVRVWGSWSVFGDESSRDSSDTHTALLIDARPIAEADERKGERRKVIPARIRRDGFDYSMDYDTPWMTNRRKYDRRRTAGTIADRGKAS